MLIYDRNIVTEGGTGLEEELISKKELLEQYRISYGALYRWKRMGLIPEGWFLRRSAPTGQETYFRRTQICPRIELILQSKDRVSLEELAEELAKCYGLPITEMRGDVDAFLAQLEKNGIAFR